MPSGRIATVEAKSLLEPDVIGEDFAIAIERDDVVAAVKEEVETTVGCHQPQPRRNPLRWRRSDRSQRR